ncbi:MAG: metallopeptidase family protein, partial [Chloroflexi bacterium]|nr:metallopeptidase family protein [Chloroflexota bacterium]
KLKFELLVKKAIDTLPEEFAIRLDNVDIIVENQPMPAQLAKVKAGRGQTLFGLYEGIPLTQRGINYNMIMPDRITIFQGPIEDRYSNEDEITVTVQQVVIHEIAHHFGISDARLKELGR